MCLCTHGRVRVVRVYSCVCVCEYVQCVSCASMCVRVCFARVCVSVCVCLGQISSLPSVTLRIQSSPDGADSNFLRWLTDFHVINNNVVQLYLFQATFSIAVLRKKMNEFFT